LLAGGLEGGHGESSCEALWGWWPPPGVTCDLGENEESFVRKSQ